MKKIAKSEKNVAATESTPSTASASAPAPIATPASPAAPVGVVATMTDPAVKECAALLDQVVERLGAEEPMDGDQVRRATKMRKGGGGVIPKILALCQQHGVTKIGSLTIEEMSAQLSRGDALVQVGLRTAVVQKKVKEGAMVAHGRSWQIGTTMYTTLQRLAVDDPELALGLAPIQSFFQTKATKGRVRANKKASAAKKAAANGEVAAVATSAPVPSAPVNVAPVEATPAAAHVIDGAASTPASSGGALPAPQAPAPASGAS